jgi:hypothetical protein
MLILFLFLFLYWVVIGAPAVVLRWGLFVFGQQPIDRGPRVNASKVVKELGIKGFTHCASPAG